MKKHIPNTITCLNLFSGCIACVMAFHGNYTYGLLWIVIAAVFDFLDGFSARLLKAYSPMGKELDSLADAISFGMAPGMIVFTFLNRISGSGPDTIVSYLSYLAFLIPVFSALRLAKFNLDERQTTSFIGLPTPANALFWGSFVVGMNTLFPGETALFYVILPLILIFCLLMVSEVPMFSLKFKNYGWKGNELRYILLISGIVFISIWGYIGIGGSILAYILMSVVAYSTSARKR